jgi:hypothetical protein
MGRASLRQTALLRYSMLLSHRLTVDIDCRAQYGATRRGWRIFDRNGGVTLLIGEHVELTASRKLTLDTVDTSFNKFRRMQNLYNLSRGRRNLCFGLLFVLLG